MAFLPRPSSPRVAWRDLKLFLSQRRKHEIVFAMLAIFFPAMIIWGFYIDSDFEKAYERPEIIWVKNYEAGRTRADIVAQQQRDLPGEIAERQRIEKLLAERRAPFKRLDKKLDDAGL